MRKIVFDFSNVDKSEVNNDDVENRRMTKTAKEQIYEQIDAAIKGTNGKVGLGIHAVRKEKLQGRSTDEVLKGICENGLDIKKGSSVLATVSSLGTSSELKHHQKEAIKSYRLGSEIAENGVIVLVPTILEGNGQQLFVGFPGMDTSAIGNNHKTTCILDRLCCGDNEYGEIPKEFILGYFKEENGERVFQKNISHFLEMSDEEKGMFIESLSSRLTEQERQISEAVISGDISRLEQISLELYGNKDGVLGDNTVIQNAMFYMDRRNIEQTKQDSSKDITTGKGKHKILLSAYQATQIKQEDLSNAHGELSKTKNERDNSIVPNEQEIR